MKRFLVLLAAFASLGAAACSQPRVIVEATNEEDGESMALAELPVQLLPYDRDAIFDSLEAAYGEPEPAIPPEILEEQQRVQAAQEDWREAEDRWSTVRDSLRSLAEELESMRNRNLRTTPQYRQAFERFGRLETEERQVNQRRQEAFTRFDELQRASLARGDSIRAVREAWAERAFADYGDIVQARLEASGREEYADTTNEAGLAAFRVPEGQWWAYARYAGVYDELYWNVPVEVNGDSVSVRLSPANAERRPLM